MELSHEFIRGAVADVANSISKRACASGMVCQFVVDQTSIHRSYGHVRLYQPIGRDRSGRAVIRTQFTSHPIRRNGITTNSETYRGLMRALDAVIAFCSRYDIEQVRQADQHRQTQDAKNEARDRELKAARDCSIRDLISNFSGGVHLFVDHAYGVNRIESCNGFLKLSFENGVTQWWSKTEDGLLYGPLSAPVRPTF